MKLGLQDVNPAQTGTMLTGDPSGPFLAGANEEGKVYG